MSYRVIAHSRSGEVSYRGTEVHASYGAAEREARAVARRAGLTDVHVVKDGRRIVGEVKARGNPNRFTSVGALHRAVMGAIRRAGERYLDDSTAAMKDGGFFSCRPAHLKKFTTALAKFGIVYRTKMIGASAVVFYDAKDNVAGYRRAGLRGELRKAARKVGLRRRRNPDIDALSWPPAWGTAGKSKKDFKTYVAKHGIDAEVMCHGMRSVPGSLRDLPRAKYVVYGGTSNPNVSPAKWYATLDLTGATPKVS